MPPAATLLRRLEESAEAFSTNQRVLARFVAANYQAVAFATISELAEQSGVSEATIVRFAKALDFSGYPALQKEIRRLVRAELPGAERLKLGARAKPAAATPLDLVIDNERENIASLHESFDAKSFGRAREMLRGASEVLVAGTRSTAALACHLAFALNKLAIATTRALSISSETYDLVSRLEKRALVVVIGFPRYLRETVDLLEFARGRGLSTLTITDSAFSPLKGEVSLYAPAESASFVAFHCAPLILVNALVHELSVADGERTLEALDRFEEVAEDRRYFVKT
ncbi:MAG TPA: MurR/RpiR family transcriptional regulator [Burkholderiales bacterium]|nr:MurR/RpiR family transcriptional regulator [Burkholderiales bacterium]